LVFLLKHWPNEIGEHAYRKVASFSTELYELNGMVIQVFSVIC